MCTNFRLAWLEVDVVEGEWVLRWGKAECSAMWYDAKGYGAMQWEVEKTVATLFKVHSKKKHANTRSTLTV